MDAPAVMIASAAAALWTIGLVLVDAFERYILTDTVANKLREAVLSVITSTVAFIVALAVLAAFVAFYVAYRYGPRLALWLVQSLWAVLVAVACQLLGVLRGGIAAALGTIAFGLTLRLAFRHYDVLNAWILALHDTFL